MRRATFHHGLSLGLLLGVALTLSYTAKTRFSSPVIIHSPSKSNNGSRPSERATMESEPAKTPRYKAVDLGLPEGCVSIEAKAASPDFHYIVGTAQTRTVSRAFVWKNGTYQYLSSKYTIAWAVNNSGTVVGEEVIDSVNCRAVVWKDGKMERLFQDKARSVAQGIDNQGNIYGMHTDPSGGSFSRAFLRRPDGSTLYFDAEPQRSSFFHCVNEKQQVVLTLSPPHSEDGKAVVWKNKRMRPLPPLEPGQRCLPQGINDKGDVVGIYRPNSANIMPIIWKNYKPSLLGTSEIKSGEATAINAKGDVIGRAYLKGAERATPFLFHQDTFYQLNTLITNKVEVGKPLQISDDGTILSSNFVSGTECHAYLLIPK